VFNVYEFLWWSRLGADMVCFKFPSQHVFLYCGGSLTDTLYTNIFSCTFYYYINMATTARFHKCKLHWDRNSVLMSWIMSNFSTCVLQNTLLWYHKKFLATVYSTRYVHEGRSHSSYYSHKFLIYYMRFIALKPSLKQRKVCWEFLIEAISNI